MFCDIDGTIVMGAHGIRSLKTHQLLKENAQMPIASTTKSMKPASILKLQDKKLLNVQDPVSKYMTVVYGMRAKCRLGLIELLFTIY